MRSKDTSPPAPRWAWLALVGVGVIGQILMIFYFHDGRTKCATSTAYRASGSGTTPGAPSCRSSCCSSSSRSASSIGRLVRFLVRQLNRVAPPRISAVVVVVLLLALSIALLNGVVVRFGMSALNKTFAAANDETDPEFAAPTSPLRSGGPDSAVTWESLGHQGRVFVSAGPTVDELTEFNGRPAIEPIRAYAGLHSADGIKATAALAAAGTAAEGRSRSCGGRCGHHDRHRLDQRGRGLGAGVHVQRRHRDRVHAVLVLAQLVVLPR